MLNWDDPLSAIRPEAKTTPRMPTPAPDLAPENEVEAEDGHWSSGSTHSASPVYDTTMCCLCLEVYYRYLPTYARADEVSREPRTREEEDIKIAVDASLKGQKR